MDKPFKVGNALLTNEAVASLEFVQDNYQVFLDSLSNIRRRLIELSFGNEDLNLMGHMREIQILEDQIKGLANIEIASYG